MSADGADGADGADDAVTTDQEHSRLSTPMHRKPSTDSDQEELISLDNNNNENKNMNKNKNSKSATRLRIGFLSSYFFRHSVGRLLAQIIMRLNPYLFEVHIISITDKSSHKQDDLTESLRNIVTKEDPKRWHSLSGTITSIASTVRELQLNTIVFGDVFMDSVTAHVAMYRLASIQIAFWGHPFSTGFTSFDYFISTDEFEMKSLRDNR